MAIVVHPELVSSVLVSTGWMVIAAKSFNIDSWTVQEDATFVLHEEAGWAARLPNGDLVSGPLRGLLAVQYTEPKE